MSAPLIAGCVVHAVSGHGHDGAAGLQRPDDPQFVVRGDPRIDGDVRRASPEFLVGHALEFRARHRRGARGDAEFAGQGDRGAGVVAGDHDHADPGGAALRDGGPGFGPWRVVHPGQADEHQVAFDRVGLEVGGRGGRQGRASADPITRSAESARFEVSARISARSWSVSGRVPPAV